MPTARGEQYLRDAFQSGTAATEDKFSDLVASVWLREEIALAPVSGPTGATYGALFYENVGATPGSTPTPTGTGRVAVTDIALYVWKTETGYAAFGPYRTMRSVSANAQLLFSDLGAAASATGGTVTVTLPAAASVPGLEYTVVKTDSGNNHVIVDGSGSETINGALTAGLTGQYDSVTVVPAGTAWYVKSRTT